MTDLNRKQVMNMEYADELEPEFEYDSADENSVVKHIFEIKDKLSYEILREELIDSLEIDKQPEFLDGDSRNLVRIISENIENLQITESEDKLYLETLKGEIRQIVLDHLEETYKIKYCVNEAEPFIDLTPIADLYEFFIIRKLKNIFKYYYSIINLSFFDKLVSEEEKKEFKQTLREYLISINDKLSSLDEFDDKEIKMELLTDFFNNRFKIVNCGIYNVTGFSSFLNFIVTEDDGEFVSDNIREMFYNFGGFEGIEFDDSETFKNYFECLIELENANELLVMLASKVFED